MADACRCVIVSATRHARKTSPRIVRRNGDGADCRRDSRSRIRSRMRSRACTCSMNDGSVSRTGTELTLYRTVTLVYSVPMAETKQWMTAKRIERGPEAAEAELRRWAKDAATRAGFRPVHISGNATALRADALASRRDHVGSKLVARKFKAQAESNLGMVVVSVAAIGGGFLLGRWWKHRQTATTVHGAVEKPNPYLVGTCVLGAR